ncbi:MAG: TonB-dependent receptor [Pseudomonadota bacterium]
MSTTIRTAVYVGALSVLATQVHAQVLEEILVTAQKREQNLQDVGIAVTAFSGDQVEQLGWRNAEQVAAQTPGLVATSYNGANTISLFSIRGVAQTDFNDHQEAPTVVYTDGVYIAQTSAAGAAMFDTERVEVLKGPQGTLYGRNATGGLVHLISRRPTDTLEGYVDAEVSEFSTTRLTGVVSGPISDSVRGRLSVMKQDSDGYYENRLGPDLRSLDATNVRLQLEADIGERLSAHWVASWGEADYGAAAYTHRVATLGADGGGVFGGADTDFGGYMNNDFYSGDFSDAGPNDAEGWLSALTLEYELSDNMTLVSITGLQNNEKTYQEDSDSSPAVFGNFGTEQDADTFTQEVRIDGTSDSLNWTVGGYYLEIEGDYRAFFQFPDYFGYGTLPNNVYDLETTSWAVFGQVEYEISDTLSFTAGLRWTEDEKDFNTNASCIDTTELDGCNDFGLVQGSVQTEPTVVDLSPLSLSRDDSDYTGKLQLDWRPAEDVLVYASLNRGMKAGGFLGSIDGATTLPDLSFEDEILTTYEAGLKMTFWDNRARLNASAFYYDYSDYQAFVFQGITSVIRNNDAEITGAEIELTLQPANGLDLLFGASFLDAVVQDVDRGAGDIRDQDMVLAPDITLNFLGRKAWDLGGNGTLALQIDGQYVDEQQFNTINSEAASNESYSLWNARLVYEPTDNWSAELFVNNVTDEEYWTYGFDLALFFGSAILAVGEPRWAGASVRYSF